MTEQLPAERQLPETDPMPSNDSPARPQFTLSAAEQLHADNEVVFDNCAEGILITDSNRVIIRINPAFTRITGYESAEVLGKKTDMLSSHRHDKPFYQQMEAVLQADGRWSGEIWNRRKNGEIFSQWISIIHCGKGTGNDRYIGIFTDLTGYGCTDNPVRNFAYYDSLTGLPNRMLLYDRLTFMLNLARRRKGIMGVLQLDLNRFKIINDTLGYVFGDQLLQSMAQRLKACTREVDSVFRLGDDGFAVLLDDIVHPQDAARVAKRILTTCSQPFTIGDKELYVTVSIGVSLYPSDGDQFELLLKNAETAMRRAKELGISNYQHYKPTMNTQAFEQLTLEHNLQKALHKNQFIVFYQPIINLAVGEITGAEALVRWNHPDLGMISPVQFIPLAEEIGLIIPIGEWVLETACLQMRRWQDRFGRPFIVSVNLSARQFQQQDLVSVVGRILERTRFDPHRLKLEITESVGMKNPEQTIHTLRQLKDMGILIAIDDFGTGYSSLSYLNRFPIDTLKIDRSFVMELNVSTPESAIIDAIIAMAHSLGLNVIAEGVETPEQGNYLRGKGCEEVQGFYFSKPLNAEDFLKILVEPPWLKA